MVPKAGVVPSQVSRTEEETVPAQVAVRLRRYQSTSYFRRILLMVVARQLGANDLPEIYNAFKASQLASEDLG